MKKIASIAVAMGLVASFAATASAAEVSGTPASTPTVTGSTYGDKFETVITQADLKPATPMIILTKATPFHLSVGSMTPAGWLSAQTIDTTGAVMTDSAGNEWREIYTWLGKAWIKVPVSAYVITPAL